MASTDIENKTEENIPITNDTSKSDEHSHTCDDPTHHHNFPSYFNQNDLHSTSSNEKLIKRKIKKAQQQNTIRTESIPGHRGNENIDDLLNFINTPTPINNKKQKKKTTTTTTTN